MRRVCPKKLYLWCKVVWWLVGRMTEKTAYRLAAEGKIPGFKVGGSWRFRRSEIEGWIDKKVTRKEAK